MAVHACKRFRKKPVNGSIWDDWLHALDDTQAWLVASRKVKMGFEHLDYVLVDEEKSIILEGILSEDDIRQHAAAFNTHRQATATPSASPVGGSTEPFYWELRTLDALSTLDETFPVCADAVIQGLPGYEKGYADDLRDQLISTDTFVENMSINGHIPKDRSTRSLGNLLILCALRNHIESRECGDRVRLTIVDGHDVIANKTAPESLKRKSEAALLELAGLDRQEKEAPATKLAVALGLLPPPIDLSMAPAQDFYL